MFRTAWISSLTPKKAPPIPALAARVQAVLSGVDGLPRSTPPGAPAASEIETMVAQATFWFDGGRS
jgi:hypothetical protein